MLNTSAGPNMPNVSVDSGELKGLILPNGLRRFLGVPYAEPPVGDLRWRPPQPVSPWTNHRSALDYGPSSMQKPPLATSIYSGGETNFSEDCLYLNVWTGSAEDTGRPVIVWLHFGAHQFGSASNTQYDGAALAAEGITVVSINWRLGRFGFLAHPDLTAESGYGGSGNYGLMDQIAALQWIQRNIAVFGGDPANVTLAGVSAGGNSVHALRASPLAKGLFSKVIAMSGSGVAPPADGHGHPGNLSTLAAAEQAGTELAEILGSPSIAKMRKLPAETIMAAKLPRMKGCWSFDIIPGAKISLHVFDTGYPIVDGHVMKQTPLQAFLSGTVIDTPMLASNTGNEASGLPHIKTVTEYQAYVTKTFPSHAENILKLYPASTDNEARFASWDLIQDQIFVWSTWTAARLQSRMLKSPVWYSRFLRAPPIAIGSAEREYAGAFHAADVMYAFGNIDKRPWGWTDHDRTLSAALMRTWINFARTGNPNVEGEVSWPQLELGSKTVKIWDIEPRMELNGPAPDRMAFWDAHHGIDSCFI
ncbi:para-nitrobenzyl esterase [Ilyonectria destructans]|nr:para-nitrobenzyl esterase [Ilyonectria destructans]